MEAACLTMNLIPNKLGSFGGELKIPAARMASPLGMQDSIVPTIKSLFILGSEAYVYLKPEDRRRTEKIAPCAKPGRLIGYDDPYCRILWG